MLNYFDMFGCLKVLKVLISSNPLDLKTFNTLNLQSSL